MRPRALQAYVEQARGRRGELLVVRRGVAREGGLRNVESFSELARSRLRRQYSYYS